MNELFMYLTVFLLKIQADLDDAACALRMTQPDFEHEILRNFSFATGNGLIDRFDANSGIRTHEQEILFYDSILSIASDSINPLYDSTQNFAKSHDDFLSGYEQNLYVFATEDNLYIDCYDSTEASKMLVHISPFLSKVHLEGHPMKSRSKIIARALEFLQSPERSVMDARPVVCLWKSVYDKELCSALRRFELNSENLMTC